MKQFLQRHWFPLLGGVFGFVAAAVDYGFMSPMYWIGLAFGVAVYIGCGMEDRT